MPSKKRSTVDEAKARFLRMCPDAARYPSLVEKLKPIFVEVAGGRAPEAEMPANFVSLLIPHLSKERHKKEEAKKGLTARGPAAVNASKKYNAEREHTTSIAAVLRASAWDRIRDFRQRALGGQAIALKDIETFVETTLAVRPARVPKSKAEILIYCNLGSPAKELRVPGDTAAGELARIIRRVPSFLDLPWHPWISSAFILTGAMPLTRSVAFTSSGASRRIAMSVDPYATADYVALEVARYQKLYLGDVPKRPPDAEYRLMLGLLARLADARGLNASETLEIATRTSGPPRQKTKKSFRKAMENASYRVDAMLMERPGSQAQKRAQATLGGERPALSPSDFLPSPSPKSIPHHWPSVGIAHCEPTTSPTSLAPARRGAGNYPK